ncbi:MAG: hypothetical protein R2798_05925 [Chitinophagales bacterium]|nr:hypothetical protein [Bacteroidota bacterium]
MQHLFLEILIFLKGKNKSCKSLRVLCSLSFFSRSSLQLSRQAIVSFLPHRKCTQPQKMHRLPLILARLRVAAGCGLGGKK